MMMIETLLPLTALIALSVVLFRSFLHAPETVEVGEAAANLMLKE